MDSLAEKARHFAGLHKQRGILILPNAWDAASVRIFPWLSLWPASALARTPQSIAPHRTFRDGSGYLARVIRDVAAAGIVGVNLEDAHLAGRAMRTAQKYKETLQ